MNHKLFQILSYDLEYGLKQYSHISHSPSSAVVRRVLTNVLDRVEMEDMRDRERSRKRRKKKKSLGRVPGKSTDEKDQIRYFGKLDILLGRRKEQLKRTFFKKRQYLVCELAIRSFKIHPGQ